jgi:hypothetical protein
MKELEREARHIDTNREDARQRLMVRKILADGESRRLARELNERLADLYAQGVPPLWTDTCDQEALRLGNQLMRRLSQLPDPSEA